MDGFFIYSFIYSSDDLESSDEYLESSDEYLESSDE